MILSIWSVATHSKSNFLLRDSQNKRGKHAEMKEIKMVNIDLDKANAELTAEIECLNEKIIELKAIHIEDLQYKERIRELIKKGF